MNTFRLLVLSLAIISLFPRKHVHVFWKTRTTFPKNMYVFPEKDVRVFFDLFASLEKIPTFV